MRYSFQEKGTLLLTLIAGLSINATFSTLFNPLMVFSPFPVICLILCGYCLHQRYRHRTMPDGLPGLAAACFILGVLVYSAVVRAEYPALGSNFLPALLSVILVLAIGYRIRRRRQGASSR